MNDDDQAEQIRQEARKFGLLTQDEAEQLFKAKKYESDIVEISRESGVSVQDLSADLDDYAKTHKDEILEEMKADPYYGVKDIYKRYQDERRAPDKNNLTERLKKHIGVNK